MIGPAGATTPADLRDDVFVTLQRGAATVAGKALQQAALRQMAGNAALSDLLRTRQDLTDQQKISRAVLSDAVGRRGAEAEAEIERAQGELDILRDRIAALDLRIEDAFPSFKDLTNPRPMTRAEVQQTLAPDEALIVTLTGDWEIFIWAISKESADWISVPLSEEDLATKVTFLRRMLDVTSQNRAAAALEEDADISVSADAFDRAVAHDLYQQLLAPLEHVFGHAKHLISVVDGPLTSLPLAVLVASPPQGRDDDPAALRATDWMISRYAMTTLPNVASLRALRRIAADAAADTGDRQPFLGFGDPVFQYRESAPGQATGIEADAAPDNTPVFHGRGVFEAVSEVSRLTQLPNTATELRRLARITGVGEQALYLGHAATEAAVRGADLSRTDILAFATHGLLSGELAGLSEPALVFTPPGQPSLEDDALLTASEAATLKLSAKLIILSACNTAGSDGTPGAEGLSGLARAFIYAGARSILVSHWPVDDYATSVLTTGMVAEMETGTRRGEALRLSILGLMHEEGGKPHAHPRYWAPFILVGEG